MTNPVLFQSLSLNEKIEFFVKCQELLMTYHPESEFLFTKENFEARKHWVNEFLNKYKGYAYYDDNVCLLFNHVRVDDARNPSKTLKDHIYKEPRQDYNAYSIDFVVFKKLGDCINFCKSQYSPRIEWVIFVKNNEIKLYKTDKLLAHLNAPLGAMF